MMPYCELNNRQTDIEVRFLYISSLRKTIVITGVHVHIQGPSKTNTKIYLVCLGGAVGNSQYFERDKARSNSTKL